MKRRAMRAMHWTLKGKVLCGKKVGANRLAAFRYGVDCKTCMRLMGLLPKREAKPAEKQPKPRRKTEMNEQQRPNMKEGIYTQAMREGDMNKGQQAMAKPGMIDLTPNFGPIFQHMLAEAKTQGKAGKMFADLESSQAEALALGAALVRGADRGGQTAPPAWPRSSSCERL